MIEAFATSDVGKARQINEDSFYLSKPEDTIKIFIVADGMGGYNGGEIASKLAVEAARNYIISNFEKIDNDSLYKQITNYMVNIMTKWQNISPITRDFALVTR